jgi:molybdopterin molybdotransferase
MMISIDEAYRIVMKECRSTGAESVGFTVSSGRILAEDIISDVDMPPFNRAAVDGFACRKEDIASGLKVLETIRAGRVPVQKPGKGECSRIMTGAIVPEGCDMVFPVEDSEEPETGIVRFTGKVVKTNISWKAEDVRAGEIVLRKFKFIRPQDIAVLASVGKTEVLVSRMPRVAVISTGDELVEPGIKPQLSQIRNSNAYQLLAQSSRAGARAFYSGIAPDDEEATFRIIEKALADSDIVILTGGVSMGDFDFVPSVLKRAGVKLLFDQVNVQPGKPTTFGVSDRSAVFGLPGNPVSSFIQFETLVRPFISRMMNYEWSPVFRQVTMADRYERRFSARYGWIPVRITPDNRAEVIDYHGSAHITAFPYADGIIGIEPGKKTIEKGETVNVRQI